MNILQVKSSAKRFEVPDISNLSIKAYGSDNLYPQMMLDILANSPTGTLCVRRMARFIEGRGFKDQRLYGYVINSKGQTMDDILKLISADQARFKGFALHVNYNALVQVVEIHHVPFENCRVGSDDSEGYIGKIAVHPDWSGKKKQGGKQLKVSKTTADYIDVFNPIKEVVLSQIEFAGGIELYKGQILYCSGDGSMTYPTPMCDPVVTEMSTEEGLGNVSYRNTRNHFLVAGLLIKKKNSTNSDDADDDFMEGLAKFQGDTEGNKIIGVTVESDEDAPKFEPFVTENFDKTFELTEKRTVEKIYAAFEQEKFYRIRSGSLGFSSDIATDVMNDYSDNLISDRQSIERELTKIFKHWKEFVCDNFSIIPIYQEINTEDEKSNTPE